jgi:hypothetical protein
MKLELYKAYADRKGRKCVVVHYGKNNSRPFLVWDYQTNTTQHYLESGSYGTEHKSDYDLIEEWKEPEVFEDEVVLYYWDRNPNALVAPMSNLKSAGIVNDPNFKILARKKIKITEGEGL